jgi:hypothetical protein
MSTHLPPSTLRSGQVRVVNASEGLTLTVLQGRLWVTVPNDPCDHFIPCGTEFGLSTPGVVLEPDMPSGPGPVSEVRYTLKPVRATVPVPASVSGDAPQQSGKARTASPAAPPATPTGPRWWGWAGVFQR